MEVAFSSVSYSYSKPSQEIRQRRLFRKGIKAFGRVAAVTAFALLIPLTAPMMTSCSKKGGEHWEKVSAAKAKDIFSLSWEYSPSGVLSRVAHAMKCRELMPCQKGPFVGYHSPYGLILSTPGITAEQCLNDEKGFERVSMGRMARRSNGDRPFLEYDGRYFNANGFDCIVNALESQGIRYQLLYNTCYFDGRDEYSDPSILFGNKQPKIGSISMGFLCFFLPSDVVILVPSVGTVGKDSSRLLKRDHENGLKENIFFRMAGPSKLKRNLKIYSESAADAVPGVPLFLFAVGAFGGAMDAAIVGLVVSGVAGAVEASRQSGTVERKTLREIEATIPGEVKNAADLIFGSGNTPPNIYFSGDQKGVGYGNKKILVASVTYSLSFVDEGLLKEAAIIKKHLVGYSTISFDAGAPNLWKTTDLWYDYGRFHRVKSVLGRLGVGYALAYCPKMGTLIFVADTDPPIFIHLYQSGSTRSSYAWGRGDVWFVDAETGRYIDKKDW